MKKGLIGLLGVLIYSIPALALAQGSYMGVEVGGVILEDAAITEAGSPDVITSFNTGFGIGGFVGYHMSQNLRGLSHPLLNFGR